MLDNETCKKAVTRNLYELAHARLERVVLGSFDGYLEQQEVYHSGENFFTITMRALFNSMMGHAIKVLDRNKDSATFWAIFETAPDKVKRLSCYTEEKLQHLNKVADNLKPVRDKTHFHIDRNGVLDPKTIWQDANITGVELGESLGYAWEMLGGLHFMEFGRQFRDPCESYDGKDVVQILEATCSIGILKSGAQSIPKVVR